MAELTPPVSEDDHSKGPPDAPVTLVEYGDFQCSHCASAYPIVKAAREQLGDDLRVVYRHFPLKQQHPRAYPAAEAAEAAAAQSAELFWPMHDLIFENQPSLRDEDLLSYAEQAGADADKVRQALEGGTYTDDVKADFRSGVESGVNGTPTFFINGERYSGTWHDEEAFIADLKAAASS